MYDEMMIFLTVCFSVCAGTGILGYFDGPLNCTLLHDKHYFGLNSNIIVEMVRVVQSRLAGCYYCVDDAGVATYVMPNTYARLCRPTDNVRRVALDNGNWDKFYGKLHDYCRLFPSYSGYQTFFECMRNLYFELFDVERVHSAQTVRLAPDSLYVHFRLGDEKTDVRQHLVEAWTEHEYASIVTSVRSNFGYRRVYFSSADTGKISAIAAIACDRMPEGSCVLLDSVYDIGNVLVQTAFFEELARKNTTVLGSLSSNFETVMMLHRPAPAHNFIELYHGCFWNMHHCRRNFNIHIRKLNCH